jgi:hypothetical protein
MVRNCLHGDGILDDGHDRFAYGPGRLLMPTVYSAVDLFRILVLPEHQTWPQ